MTHRILDIEQPSRNRDQEIKDFITEQRFKKRPKRETFHMRSGGFHGKKRIIWLSVFSAVLILLGAGSVYFSRARVTVVPRQESFSMESAEIVLSKGTDEIDSSFEQMVLSDSVSDTAVSGIAESSKLFAKGIVRIYNTTTRAERLPSGTVLRSADNFLYKIDRTVTVPAQKKEGGEITPGSVEVGIVAEKVGREYNSDETDFIIEKFKTTSKKDSFFARSVTPISGGESGVRYVLDDESRNAIESQLKAKLTDRLIRQIKTQLPEGYLYYESLIFISTELDVNSLRSETTTLTPTLKGNIEAIIINEEALTNAIAHSVLSQYKNEDKLLIPKIETLSVSAQPLPLPGTLPQILSLRISGNNIVVWEIPELEIRQKATGLSKKQFTSLLRDFASVSSAEVSFVPFWVTHFPKNQNRIRIHVDTSYNETQ